jgi:hypothetical protein
VLLVQLKTGGAKYQPLLGIIGLSIEVAMLTAVYHRAHTGAAGLR